MNKLIESIKIIENYMKEDEAFIGIVSNGVTNKLEVQTYHPHFKELVNDLDIEPFHVYVEERESEYPFRLSVEKDGVVFFTIVSEEVYFKDFDDWIELPFTDEEFITESNLTTYERKLKESGHKQHDFM